MSYRDELLRAIESWNADPIAHTRLRALQRKRSTESMLATSRQSVSTSNPFVKIHSPSVTRNRNTPSSGP